MPALHRRILPNCRPMVDGEMRKCSAGACPPLGSGWGAAEATMPISCTKPQLRLFITWCAGGRRHEQLVPIRGTSQTDSSRSFRRGPSLPAPQLVALCSPQSRLTTPTKLAAQLGERSFPLFPSLYERDLLLLSTRIFPRQHLASCDRLIRSSTICYPCARSVPAISVSPWERAGVRDKAGICARGNNDAQTRPPTGTPNFSYLRVPAPAGITDWYDNTWHQSN